MSLFWALQLVSALLCIIIQLSTSSNLRNAISDTLVVDQHGGGNFTTIQSAIDYIPLNNNRWIQIRVKAGVYKEQVTIPWNKPFVYLNGEGHWKTRVEWMSQGAIEVATFMAHADNVLVKGISIVNTLNSPPGSNNNSRQQAVAALVSGDKCAFYGVAFYSVQDTLWDVQGRHYFESCTIEGAVDFIFGAGQSVYERCKISVVAGISKASPGYITAQGRSHSSDPNGFVFKDCLVFGNGQTYLGRAWRPYARVIFLYTLMENIIVPEGWDAWTYTGHEKNFTFGEYGCKGHGADTSHRVRWEANMTTAMVNKYGNISFIDEEGWIANQPK